MTEKQDIYICGYPRSGNTMLSRLLGDLLNSPVTGMGSAHPIAEEGLDRPGPFTIRQLHLRISYDASHTTMVPDARTLAVKQWNKDKKICFVLRDPRDVAVSAWKYWEIESLEKTIHCMGEGIAPVGFGSWQKFVGDWLQAPVYYVVVRYENLVQDAYMCCMALKSILFLNGIDLLPDRDIDAVVARQSFEARKAEIASAPADKYMYGRDVQLKAMRKGIAGDWCNHFTRKHGEMAEEYFGELMRKLHYTCSPDWWKELEVT